MTAAQVMENPGGVTNIDPRMRRRVRELLARVDFAESLRRRAVQDAITSVLAEQWHRRADLWDWASPRPGDYTGRATAEQLAEDTQRCASAAFACRAHAAMLDAGWLE